MDLEQDQVLGPELRQDLQTEMRSELGTWLELQSEGRPAEEVRPQSSLLFWQPRAQVPARVLVQVQAQAPSYRHARQPHGCGRLGVEL